MSSLPEQSTDGLLDESPGFFCHAEVSFDTKGNPSSIDFQINCFDINKKGNLEKLQELIRNTVCRLRAPDLEEELEPS